MGNSFASLMMIVWPVIAAIAFRKMPRQEAVFAALLAGYLLTPAALAIKLPGLPDLDKSFVATLGMLMVLYATREPVWKRARNARSPDHRVTLRGWLPAHPLALGLVGVMLFGAVMTGLNNPEPIWAGNRYLRGMSNYDIFSFLLMNITTLLPLLIGRKYLSDPALHGRMLFLLVMATLFYSVPTIVEILKSPFISIKIYGIFPGQWIQHIRNDGYRPVVFLEHGLRLGTFIGMGLVASIFMLRLSEAGKRARNMMILVYILALLILTKCLGATAAAVLLAPIFLWGQRRILLLTVIGFCVPILLYPMVRAYDLVPVDKIVALAYDYDPQRGQSLDVRISNEEVALQKTAERPVFGWGMNGRDRVYREDGRSVTVPDGVWTIYFSTRGWVGFISSYGLLVLPMLLIALRHPWKTIPLPTIGLMCVLVYNMIDTIPNSSITVVTWTLAGALWGYVEYALKRKKRTSRSLLKKGQSKGLQTEGAGPRPPDRPLGGTLQPQ